MDTLLAQKNRLEAEIMASKEKIGLIKESAFPDLKAIRLHTETIERNMQLISMIDNHMRCDHQPMWRRK